jgi:Icc protein
MTEVQILQGEREISSGDVIRLLQITDTHLMADVGGRLLNVDTDASLAAVVRLAAQLPRADALLITGDIAGEGAVGAYHRLDSALQPLDAPSFWLPGNHDDALKVREHWLHRFQRRLRFPLWDVLMLNSQQPGEVGGRVSEAELAWVKSAVNDANAAGKNLLLALHHPLRDLGCAWLDEQRVANGEAVLSELERAAGSVVVISGHVHQDSQHHHGDIQLLTTPSTCVQFAPCSEDFLADTASPGLRELELHADGRLVTRVHRVQDESFPVDLDSGGYL